jgi:hypothetical protein
MPAKKRSGRRKDGGDDREGERSPAVPLSGKWTCHGLTATIYFACTGLLALLALSIWLVCEHYLVQNAPNADMAAANSTHGSPGRDYALMRLLTARSPDYKLIVQRVHTEAAGFHGSLRVQASIVALRDAPNVPGGVPTMRLTWPVPAKAIIDPFLLASTNAPDIKWSTNRRVDLEAAATPNGDSDGTDLSYELHADVALSSLARGPLQLDLRMAVMARYPPIMMPVEETTLSMRAVPKASMLMPFEEQTIQLVQEDGENAMLAYAVPPMDLQPWLRAIVGPLTASVYAAGALAIVGTLCT